MHFDQQVDIGPDGLTNLAHGGAGLGQLVTIDVFAPGSREGVELQRVEAALVDKDRGFLGNLIGRSSRPAVCVNSNSWPYGSANQVVNRLFKCLAHDVPHGDFDSTERTVQVHCRPLGGEILMGHVHEMTDVKWIAVDEVASELIDVSLDLGIAIGLRISLAPAGDPRVGRKLQKDEVFANTGIPLYYFDIGDLQCAYSIGNRITYVPPSGIILPL